MHYSNATPEQQRITSPVMGTDLMRSDALQEQKCENSRPRMQTIEDHVALVTVHSKSLVELQRRLVQDQCYHKEMEAQLCDIVEKATQALEVARRHMNDVLSDLHCNKTKSMRRLAGRKRSFENAISDQGDQKRQRILERVLSPTIDAVQYEDITAEVEQRLRDKASNRQRELTGVQSLSRIKRKRISGGSSEPENLPGGNKMPDYVEEQTSIGQTSAKRPTHPELLSVAYNASQKDGFHSIQDDSRKRRKLQQDGNGVN